MLGQSGTADGPAILALAALAAGVGVLHTLTGPDHYVPFIAMSQIGRWSYRRTMVISFFCGVGHVLSSVLIGAVGIAGGLAVAGLEAFEGSRGAIAAWLLLGFGLAYAAWGLSAAVRSREHAHWHAHPGGIRHRHNHSHTRAHAHAHEEAPGSMTPWVLFTIFVFGPCEPLIPLLMYPAARLNLWGVLLVASVFAAATISMILVLVSIGYFGLTRVGPGPFARYAHLAAGLALSACGGAMLLGL